MEAADIRNLGEDILHNQAVDHMEGTRQLALAVEGILHHSLRHILRRSQAADIHLVLLVPQVHLDHGHHFELTQMGLEPRLYFQHRQRSFLTVCMEEEASRRHHSCPRLFPLEPPIETFWCSNPQSTNACSYCQNVPSSRWVRLERSWGPVTW